MTGNAESTRAAVERMLADAPALDEALPEAFPATNVGMSRTTLEAQQRRLAAEAEAARGAA